VLQELVPITPGFSHQKVHAFASAVAGVLAARFPKLATVARAKKLRKGRLYLDAEQNARLKTVVAPYTIRALEGAPVSAPLQWDEVSTKLKPSDFTIATMAERLLKKGDLFGEAMKRATPLVEFAKPTGAARQAARGKANQKHVHRTVRWGRFIHGREVAACPEPGASSGT
jgi:DNA primase